MKIIQLIPSLAEGGAEHLVKDYAIELKRTGNEVYYVTTDRRREGSIYEDLIEQGIDIIQLPAARVNLVIEWIKTLKAIKPDVIHGHLKVGLLMLLSNRKIRLYYTMHSKLDAYLNKWGKEFYLHIMTLVKIRKMHIFALNKEMVDDIQCKFNTDRVSFLENAISMSNFRRDANYKSRYQKEFHLPDNSYIVGHIGRFVDAKNHIKLIDIFQKLREKKEAYLFLVGVGELFENIQKIVISRGLDDYVFFLKERTDIPQLLRFFDVLVMPSKHEGFPITVIEAQAVGVRIVSSYAVPDEAVRSNNLIRIDVCSPDEEWVKVILDTGIVNEDYFDINECDIGSVVKKLEQFYKGDY